MAYNLEARARAKALFVESQLPYEQIADQTGIALSTLKEWGADEKWMEERRQFERQFLEINGKIHKLKARLIDKALKDDATDQTIYAVTNFMRASAHMSAKGSATDRAAFFIELLQEEVTFLKERDPDALRYLEPHLKAFADHIKSGAAQG